MIKYSLSIFCFLFFSINLQAQNGLIDSLENVLSIHLQKDTVRVKLLYDLAHEYRRKDLTKTLEFVDQSEALAKEIDYKKGWAKSLYLRGAVEMIQSNFDVAIEHLNKAKQLFTDINIRKGISNCYQVIGIINFYQNDYEQSIVNYKKSMQIDEEMGITKDIPNNFANIASVYSTMGGYSEAMVYLKKALNTVAKKGDEAIIANCYNNMASIYSEQGNYPLAIEYNKKSLFISEDLGDSLSIAGSLNNIAFVYEKQHNYDKTLEFLERSLAIQQKFQNSRSIAQLKSGIAGIYFEQEKHETAIIMLKESIAISREVNDMNQLTSSLIKLGQINLSLENFPIALKYFSEATKLGEKINLPVQLCNAYLGLARINFEQKKYDKALENILRSQKYSEAHGILHSKRDANALLFEIYEKKGDYKKAYRSHQQFKIQNDSLFNKENIEKITQLEYEYKYKRELDDANKRELALTSTVESTSQDLKRSQRNYLLAIIGFLLISILLGAIIFNQKLRNVKSKAQNIITEQKLLRSQMTPHLIFNSLSVLQGMILMKEDKKAISYLSKFSKLLRIILENSRDKTVSLSQELVAIENYLSLQNIEATPPFEYTISKDVNIDNASFHVPPMLIQPFIENAIEHAFGNRKENRKIDLSLTYLNKNLICTITDNGIGIDALKEHQRKDKKSLATTITSERLKILSQDYKVQGSVRIEDRKNYNEQGTLVTLALPYKIDA